MYKVILYQKLEKSYSVNYLRFSAINKNPRHCETQFEVKPRSIQSRTAASLKQFSSSKFVAKSEPEDCFVTSILQTSVNPNPHLIIAIDTSRNGKLKRRTTFAISSNTYD